MLHDICIQISISKAMKKILSKCTLKPSNGKGKLSTMEYPVLSTLAPADFDFTEVLLTYLGSPTVFLRFDLKDKHCQLMKRKSAHVQS